VIRIAVVDWPGELGCQKLVRGQGIGDAEAGHGLRIAEEGSYAGCSLRSWFWSSILRSRFGRFVLDVLGIEVVCGRDRGLAELH